MKAEPGTHSIVILYSTVSDHRPAPLQIKRLLIKLPAAQSVLANASNIMTTQLLFLSLCIRPQCHRNADNVSAAMEMAAESECTDSRVASQTLARLASPTRRESDSASRVVQLSK